MISREDENFERPKTEESTKMGAQEVWGSEKDHFVFKLHRWPFQQYTLVLPSSPLPPAQDTKPRQLAHQERGHCVLLGVIYVAGRGWAGLPVIMTLRGNRQCLFIIPAGRPGWTRMLQSSGHQVVFHLLEPVQPN